MSECKNCASLSERVTSLEKENAQLRAVLIRTPSELHRISEGVQRMGFGHTGPCLPGCGCDVARQAQKYSGAGVVAAHLAVNQEEQGFNSPAPDQASTTAQDDNTGLTLFALVAEKMDWGQKKTATWFDTPNPLLGGASPNWMLDRGRHDKLGKFIRACLDENSPPEASTQVAHPVCPKCSTPMELGKCDLWFCPVSGCTASNEGKAHE